MEKTKLVLEFIKVLLSSHIVIGSVVVTFFCIFRQEIKSLINRIASIKFPGGGEVSTSQSEKVSAELSSKKEPPSAPDAPKPELPANLSLTPDQAKAVVELIQSEKAKAYLWEYRYLNYYLVLNTQRVLDWLASLNQRINVTLFDSMWMPAIPNANERLAILNALQQHYLIILKGDLIEITPKGREYIQWRGTLPTTAT